MRFSESAAMVCPAKYCSAMGKDFCKMSEIPLHPEQLKKKSLSQREEPDGREEDHSYGKHVLSMSLHDQTDRLHNRLAAAEKYTNPDSKSTRRTPFHISELWIWVMSIIKAVFTQKSGKPLGSKTGLTSSVGRFQGCQVWSWFLFQHLQALEKLKFKSKSLFSALFISLNSLPKSGGGVGGEGGGMGDDRDGDGGATKL